MPAVVAENLRKVFANPKKQPGVWGGVKSLFTREMVETVAVEGIDLELQTGEIVGFLGPNGAGKTTTLKMLSGILYPSGGRAEVLGHVPFRRDAAMLRQIALVMGNKQQLWWDLPAWDSFTVLGELYDIPKVVFKSRLDELLVALDLEDKVHTQVRKLSLGERMKCELAAALLHRPRVVFLDEPTIGLDVVSQKRIRDFLKRLHREDDCTILLTSHYMQDVQELCERVVVIDHGRKVFEGSLDDLSRQFRDTRRVRLTLESPVQRADAERYGEIVELSDESLAVDVPRQDTARATAAMLQNLPVSDVAIEEVAMEDVIRDLFSRKSES